MRIRHQAATLLLLVAACATTGGAGGGAVRYRQADQKDPTSERDFAGDQAELAVMQDAFRYLARAQQARLSRNDDQARAEDAAAADLLASFAQKHPGNEWKLVLLRMATERHLNARQYEKAAADARQLLADPASNDTTRAIAARLAAAAWQQHAVQETRAGRIPALQLLSYEARKGADPTPQVPAPPWKAFVENVDLYGQLEAADATVRLPAEERRLAGGADTAQLMLLAAQVQFGYDHMEDAQRRFLGLAERYPSRAEVMDTAVPYYLETFRVVRDDAGYEKALARVQPVVATEARKAAEAAAVPGATEAQKKSAATFARLDDDLTRRLKGAVYTAATDALKKGEAAERSGKAAAAQVEATEKAGKGADAKALSRDAAARSAEAQAHYRQAAQLYEQFAAEQPGSPDAPNALFNAALAWDKAREPKKAVAGRERLVATYPDAKIVPQALVSLGLGHAREGNQAAAARANETYLQRWPDGPQHCIALQNLGVALQSQGKKLDAAQRYQQFANDAACLKDDPNNAARVLYEAGKLYTEAKRPSEARRVFQALVDLPGVTDSVPRSYQADAQERLTRMK